LSDLINPSLSMLASERLACKSEVSAVTTLSHIYADSIRIYYGKYASVRVFRCFVERLPYPKNGISIFVHTKGESITGRKLQ